MYKIVTDIHQLKTPLKTTFFNEIW